VRFKNLPLGGNPEKQGRILPNPSYGLKYQHLVIPPPQLMLAASLFVLELFFSLSFSLVSRLGEEFGVQGRSRPRESGPEKHEY
jgi:hypothetical protein